MTMMNRVVLDYAFVLFCVGRRLALGLRFENDEMMNDTMLPDLDEVHASTTERASLHSFGDCDDLMYNYDTNEKH